MHAISSYRGNRPTNKPTNIQTNAHTDRTDYKMHCAAKLSAQCNEFQSHYNYISHIIDFLTTFNDRGRILEETSHHSIVELIRMLHMIKQKFEHLETFTKFVHDYPEDPESPEDPSAPKNPQIWPIVEEKQREDKEEIS